MENALIKTQDISPIVQMAMKGKFDIEQLDKLIDVQEKFEKIQAKKEFYKAFSEFKREPIVIKKDSNVSYTSKKTGETTSYNHASLSNVMEVASPLLALHGLAISWLPNQENGQISVTTVLSHVLGYSVSTTLSAPPDTSGQKNSIQAVASTVTYLERYTTLAILGLATKEDNDGQGTDSQKELEYITPDQVENLKFEIDKTQRDNEELSGVICGAYKVPSLQHILSKDYAGILDRISKS